VLGALLAVPLMAGGKTTVTASAAGPSFTFNWDGSPSVPQSWVPAAANDWDLLQINNGSTDDNVQDGTFAAGHGPDCSAPPAMHMVTTLSETAYICKDHMMTAAADNDVFITPNQLVDFSQGTAMVTWQVSTFRHSQRDWWELWLMPFNENYATPTDNAPAFNGNPPNALHIAMNQRAGCSIGQDGWNHVGTMFEFAVYRGDQAIQKGGGGDCMEDAAGGPSAKTRSTFELGVSQQHIRFLMRGAAGTANFIDENVALPFNRAVVTWGHRSYSPSKACGGDGTCGPNTFHWSNVSISPAVPFTILRPNNVFSVHEGTPATVTLPEPAPANAFLRFAAYGSIQVAYDGGNFASPHMQDTAWRQEGASNYFSPIPAGTKTISFQGGTRGNVRWWVGDISVWATTAPVSLPGRTTTAPQNPAPQLSEAPVPELSQAPATPKATTTSRNGKRASHHQRGPFDGVADAFWGVIHRCQDWGRQVVEAGQHLWSLLTNHR